MNKLTIILLISFAVFIQIANALPMHEQSEHREPIVAPAPDEQNAGGKESDAKTVNDDRHENQANVKHYDNVEDMLTAAIHDHIDPNIEIERMSEGEKKHFYDLLCETGIIHAE